MSNETYIPVGDYTPALIKWALVELAKEGKKANRNEALRYLDECQYGTFEENEAMYEAEMRADFAASWVQGGGSSADVSLAWAQHREGYLAGQVG